MTKIEARAFRKTFILTDRPPNSYWAFPWIIIGSHSHPRNYSLIFGQRILFFWHNTLYSCTMWLKLKPGHFENWCQWWDDGIAFRVPSSICPSWTECSGKYPRPSLNFIQLLIFLTEKSRKNYFFHFQWLRVNVWNVWKWPNWVFLIKWVQNIHVARTWGDGIAVWVLSSIWNIFWQIGLRKAPL